MKWLPLLFLTLALAGCADDAPVEDEPKKAPVDQPQLQGWVFDPTVLAIEGVQIEVLDTGATVTTDANGYYKLDDVPLDVPVLLVATKEGYEPGSKQVQLEANTAIQLNFTLNPVPVKQSYNERLPYNGFIDCEGRVATASSDIPLQCGSDNQNVWEFNVKEDLAGAVIEIGWEPGTDLAASLGARLETIGFGDQNIVIAEIFGQSVLRLQIPNAVAEKYYTEAGTLRLIVEVKPDNEANEAGIGAGFAFNQEFDVVASLFYVEGPPPGYTAA